MTGDDRELLTSVLVRHEERIQQNEALLAKIGDTLIRLEENQVSFGKTLLKMEENQRRMEENQQEIHRDSQMTRRLWTRLALKHGWLDDDDVA